MKIKIYIFKLLKFMNLFLIDAASKKFISHNKRIWRNKKIYNKNKAEVLCEFNSMHSSIIAYSYLSNLLLKKYQAKIVVFSEPSISWIKNVLHKIISSKLEQIYKSFNTSEFIVISISRKQEQEVATIFNNIYHKLQSKRDVENITIDGIHIGDLIYDTYLRSELIPTIDILDNRFILSLKKSIGVFVFWRDYLADHNVRAINVSHCVYNLAIPLRIAINKDIPVYQINATHVYRLTKKNTHAYNDFFYFPNKFRGLPKKEQLKGVEEAKKRLERRFSGEVGIDMEYSKKSAYGGQKSQRILRKSNKIKILIATHCFFDSPHPYGLSIFPDFYEWLNFLGKISEKTDYDWYLKMHPDFFPENIEIINKLLKKYPKFTLIPSDSSHKQIIKEGIDYALTVHGTIGFEYAALGLPVINASMVNPHIAYNFNIHPETIEKYEATLTNLDNQNLLIDINEVYEYYFMKFIFNTENLFFDDYHKMIENIGGYKKQFEPLIYDFWMKKYTQEKHINIIQALEKFIDSGDFRMDHSYFKKEFRMKNIEEVTS